MGILNHFVDYLPVDQIRDNYPRTVKFAAYSLVSPSPSSDPVLIHLNKDRMNELNLPQEEWGAIFSGNKVISGTKPYAMCYGGHQFGQWAGQLGDGRAINLFEVLNEGKFNTLQLKGAGPTPYSRSGDGYAVLRSSVREYLISEAMHHLGIPTTRAISLILSGDRVIRDMFYDGNPEAEQGAIVCREAESFLRFGNYQIFMANGDQKNLKALVDFTIISYFRELGVPSKETYIKFFQEVVNRTLDLVIHWQRVGFVHGVMNTDNMSILGLTIDYGPYGWMDDYDPSWTPNTSDNRERRYQFGAQPEIALWNLLQLANAIYPLVNESKPFEEILDQYKVDFKVKHLEMMRAKLGLFEKEERDELLIYDLEDLMKSNEVDMTIFYRLLSDFKKGQSPSNFVSWNVLDFIKEAFYFPETIVESDLERWNEWFLGYSKRLEKESLGDETRKSIMNQVNPKYVLRNYMAQMAIDKAEEGDYSLIDEFFGMLKKPYDDQEKYDLWFV